MGIPIIDHYSSTSLHCVFREIDYCFNDSTMADKCISCNQTVTTRQQAIQCDDCLKWNRRTCNTGITQQGYREAVRAGASITWCCLPCQPSSPVAGSSRISEQSIDILESSDFNPRAYHSDSLQSTIYDPPAQSTTDTTEDKPSHQPILDPARDESSISEPAPETSTVPFAVTLKIIEDSTSKGRPKLIDNRGYSYGIKRRRVNATDNPIYVELR